MCELLTAHNLQIVVFSDYVFSHIPRASGHRTSGTGLLISPKWRFSLLSLSHQSISSFQFHAFTVTCPLKLNTVIIYCPPGALRELLNELDTLIILCPDDGSPLILLGDFNLPSRSGPNQMVMRLHNLRSLSPTTLFSSIPSALPSAKSFSLLSPDSVSSTLLSFIFTSYDLRCLISSWKARPSHPAPWLSV